MAGRKPTKLQSPRFLVGDVLKTPRSPGGVTEVVPHQHVARSKGRTEAVPGPLSTRERFFPVD